MKNKKHINEGHESSPTLFEVTDTPGGATEEPADSASADSSKLISDNADCDAIDATEISAEDKGDEAEGTPDADSSTNVVGDSSDVNTSETDDCAPASDGDGDAKDVITAEESNQDEDSPVAASVQDENGQDTLINEEAFFSAPLGDGEDDTEVSADENKDTENEESGDDEDAFDISCPLADENTKVQSDKPAAKERRVDSLFDFIEIFVFTLAAVFIITSFFFRYSVVNGGSMKNTLMHDERLLLTNFLYTPDRGDIVVVQDKSTALKDPIVKRVIAIQPPSFPIIN